MATENTGSNDENKSGTSDPRHPVEGSIRPRQTDRLTPTPAGAVGNDPPQRNEAGDGGGGHQGPPAGPSRGGSPFAASMAFLALLVALGVGAAGYLVWQQLVAGQQNLGARIDEVPAAMTNLETRMASRVDAIPGSVAGLETRLGALQNEIEGQLGAHRNTIEGQLRAQHSELEGRVGELDQEIEAQLEARQRALEDQQQAQRSELEAQLNELGEQLQAQKNALEERMSEFQDALEARLASLQSDVEIRSEGLDEQLRAEISDIEQRVSEIQTTLQRATAPMEPTDIKQLLHIANDSLRLQHDVETALSALRVADERLQALADPAFSETRSKVAEEISALEAAQPPDVAGMSFAIAGLQNQLLTLPVGGNGIPDGVAPGMPFLASGAGDGDGDWRALLDDAWTSLRSLVVIRRSEEHEGPLMSPDQQVFLTQNLHLKLESARVALLSRDAENYRRSLETARDWLSRYYDTGDPAVATMIDRVEELAGADVQPELPDISGSLNALRTALERRRTEANEAAVYPIEEGPAARTGRTS